MPFINCSSVKMYYEEMGGGRPLLLLPGLGCDCRVWEGVSRRLAKSYRLVMPDPRGMGRSEYDNKPFSLKRMADDFAEFIRLLGLENPVVLGHSMGGQIALQLALDYPELVSKLILVCTSPYTDAEVEKLLRKWAATRCSSDGEGMDAWLRDVYRWMVTSDYYDSPQLDSAVKYGLNLPQFKTDGDFSRQVEALAGVDLRDRLGEISVPVLIVAGAEDRIFPPGGQREMAGLLKYPVLEVLGGCAHSPLFEGTGEFVRLVLQFGA